MLPLALTLSAPAFNLPWGNLIWIGVAVAVYFVASKFGLQNVALATLPGRATTLLRFVDSLGMPMLAPLLKSVSGGHWSEIPKAVHTVLDQLDDKATRRGILESLVKSQITNRLTDPAEKESLLKFLEQKLGVSIPRGA